jgi:hypothetical protein
LTTAGTHIDGGRSEHAIREAALAALTHAAGNRSKPRRSPSAHDLLVSIGMRRLGIFALGMTAVAAMAAAVGAFATQALLQLV